MPLMTPVLGLPTKFLVYSSDTANVNLFTAAGSPAYPLKLSVTINGGVTVYGNGAHAIDIQGFATGSVIEIINNGTIVGYGGGGSAGGSASVSSSTFHGVNGVDGGTALYVRSNIRVTNNGAIYGGGGGGGGGAATLHNFSAFYSCSAGGGGGGRGFAAANGGAHGTAADYDFNDSSSVSVNGSASTSGSPGGGGAGGTSVFVSGGAGGNGGDRGAAGSNGTNGNGNWFNGNVGIGGAAGKYADGDSYITWDVTGTRGGNVS